MLNPERKCIILTPFALILKNVEAREAEKLVGRGVLYSLTYPSIRTYSLATEADGLDYKPLTTPLNSGSLDFHFLSRMIQNSAS